MTLKCVDQELLDALDASQATRNTYVLHLYKTDTTIQQSMVIGDFTEANFTGYSAQNITDFGAAYINGSSKAESDAGLYSFIQTGTGVTNSVYGYYVTTAGGALRWAERYAGAPVSMNATGKVFSVAPSITMADE